MSSRLNPYIAFDGNAREAMESYRDVFGGDLVINTFGEYRNPDPALADKTMHAQLETDRSFTLMASDGPPGAEPTKGDNISISLSGDDADELHGYWDKLSEGGTVPMPLARPASRVQASSDGPPWRRARPYELVLRDVETEAHRGSPRIGRSEGPARGGPSGRLGPARQPERGIRNPDLDGPLASSAAPFRRADRRGTIAR